MTPGAMYSKFKRLKVRIRKLDPGFDYKQTFIFLLDMPEFDEIDLVALGSHLGHAKALDLIARFNTEFRDNSIALCWLKPVKDMFTDFRRAWIFLPERPIEEYGIIDESCLTKSGELKPGVELKFIDDIDKEFIWAPDAVATYRTLMDGYTPPEKVIYER